MKTTRTYKMSARVEKGMPENMNDPTSVLATHFEIEAASYDEAAKKVLENVADKPGHYVTAMLAPERSADTIPSLIPMSEEGDWVLNPVNNGAAWIEVGNISIHIKRTLAGTVITAYPVGSEMSAPLMNQAISYQEAFEAQQESNTHSEESTAQAVNLTAHTDYPKDSLSDFVETVADMSIWGYDADDGSRYAECEEPDDEHENSHNALMELIENARKILREHKTQGASIIAIEETKIAMEDAVRLLRQSERINSVRLVRDSKTINAPEV